MGVKGLWHLLEPLLHPVNLPELRNLRLAVDLTIWICEGLSAFSQMKGKAQLLQKRVIFTRILRMLQWGIRPVFVFEGKPPALKADTLEKRGHSSYISYGILVEELKEMFTALNLPYVVSEGEAEATCAKLNATGLVDGCITDDSDAFLFGAKVVYKNFTADPHRVDQMKRCTLEDIEKKLGLTQERMVGLALLSGCDYTPGLKGIGPETVQGLYKELGTDEDIFKRLQNWKDNKELDEISAYKSLPKPSHCSRCCHVGLKKAHDTAGCNICKTPDSCLEKCNLPCTCDYHQKRSLFKSRAAEISIRTKALEVEGFPDERVIKAFLEPPINVPTEVFRWTTPDIEVLKKFARKKFNWSGEETLENVLSLYTGIDMVRSSCTKEPCKSVPIKINKKRQKQFVTVFEVQWRFVEGIRNDIEHLVTLEDANLFNECYPEIVCAYDVMVEKKKNVSRGRKRKPDDESQMKMNQFFKVRKKLFVTPSKPRSLNGVHDSAGEGTSSQETLATILPQTPPRRSPRLTPKKRVPYSPSPSRLSQGPKDFGAKGILPKRLHFSRESTPDRSNNIQTPVKVGMQNPVELIGFRSLKSSTTATNSASEEDMETDSNISDFTKTPVNHQSLFNRKDAWLPTLSPMQKMRNNGVEEEEAGSSTRPDSAFNEDYKKVKESMTFIDLCDSDTSAFSSAKIKTPSLLSAVKSAKKSSSKSTSKKLKTPSSGQMRINSFVKRRLLRS